MIDCREFAQNRKAEVDVRSPAEPICSGDWSCATHTFPASDHFLSVTLGFLQHESLSNPLLLARAQ